MKTTKQIILIILSALFIISAVACGKVDDAPKGGESTPPSEDKDPAVLSEELVEEIKAAWQTKNGEVAAWDSATSSFDKIGVYYGTYNECIVFFKDTGDNALSNLVIEEEEFIFRNCFIIYVYKDGEFHELSSAYQNGILKYSDIAEIKEHHKSLYPSYYEENAIAAQPVSELTMTAEEANAVKQAYINKYKDSVTVEGIHIKLYGKTDKAFVMIIESDSLDYPAVISGLTVDGLTFTFGNNNLPEVYSGGELYGLKEAFDGGILTSENLRTLYGNFTQKIFTKF